ncbi:MAG: hypothetical protein ABIP01_03005 [Candidatus Limnocylindria bacterium]
MMEGYSVTEAALVLGVPTERVWELLARGVLSGAPEGDTGMRVYLQPRPAPAPPQATPSNGNGGTHEPDRERLPFRELLTEFRGLTERYGQALLALGEARGEVAALRSRVDLLEARMDLRLPPAQPASPPTAWTATPIPFPAERAVVPTAPTAATEPMHDEAEAGPEVLDEAHRRTRRRGPRRATESFAEALARAEDPSAPELPDAIEAAAALTALRHTPEASTDAELPRELPAAEAVLVADEADTTEAELAAPGGIDMAEPMPQVEAEPEGEVVAQPEPAEAIQPEPVAADPEPATEPEPQPVEMIQREPVVTEPEPSIEPEPEPVAVEPEPVAAIQPEPVAADPEPATEPEPEPEPVAVEPEGEVAAEPEPVELAAEPEPEPEPDTTEPFEWDRERYTTTIEEPDWFAAEIVEPEQPISEAAEEEPPSASDEAEREVAPVESSQDEPASDEAEQEGAAVESAQDEPVPELQEPMADAAEVNAAPPVVPRSGEPAGRGDEETMLWFGRSPDDASGASEMEVATSGRRPSEGGPDLEPELPGSSDLDEALAGLRALARRADEPVGPVAEQPEQASAEAVDAEPDEWPPRSVTVGEPAQPPQPPQGMASGSATTTSPASRAYRRLRRIFPG